MSSAPTGEIRDSLAAGRAQADRILAAAERHAAELTAMAAEADQALVDARTRRLQVLRAEIEEHQRRIEAAYVAMAEAMARAATRLAESARHADFSAPAWPGGIRSAFELKLSETREMTFRVERGVPAPFNRDLGVDAIEEHREKR